MNKTDFKAIAEFINKCDNILKVWNASILVETVIELHSVERDTSASGYEHYYAGSIAQVIEPKLKLRITVFQDDEFQQPEPPFIPTQTIDQSKAALDFYFAGLKQCLSEEFKRINCK